MHCASSALTLVVECRLWPTPVAPPLPSCRRRPACLRDLLPRPSCLPLSLTLCSALCSTAVLRACSSPTICRSTFLAHLRSSIAMTAKINVDVQAVSDWAGESDLLLSVPKTQAMIVASDQRRIHLYRPFVVQYQNKIRNLGLVIKSNLSWDSQISAISTSVHGVLHRLRARSRMLTTSVRRLLTSALVLPHFDYACAVFPVLTDELKTQLHRLLNTTIRFVFGLRREARMLPYLRKLGWLTPSSRRDYFVAAQLHHVLRQERLAYL
ncbi:unnamed protein product [Trichogramma brassicae]|uniref:Reverse transcriptase domain-containing protein n=1 Tax=Trichogramma brassicae TaxID=86971 RepID=A0A6H5HX66_9HYME|nr:unnamed protein product [Trichogramma brassicae]